MLLRPLEQGKQDIKREDSREKGPDPELSPASKAGCCSRSNPDTWPAPPGRSQTGQTGGGESHTDPRALGGSGIESPAQGVTRKEGPGDVRPGPGTVVLLPQLGLR